MTIDEVPLLIKQHKYPSVWCCSSTRSAIADCSWTSQERKRLCYQHGCGWRIFVSGK